MLQLVPRRCQDLPRFYISISELENGIFPLRQTNTPLKRTVKTIFLQRFDWYQVFDVFLKDLGLIIASGNILRFLLSVDVAKAIVDVQVCFQWMLIFK